MGSKKLMMTSGCAARTMFIQLAHQAGVFGQFGQGPQQRGGVVDRAAVFIFELQRRQLA